MSGVYEKTKSLYLGSNDVFEFCVANDLPNEVRIYWQLRKEFTEDENTFRIMRNYDYGNPDSWETIGEVTNTWFFVDNIVKFSGKEKQRIAYLVVLVRDNVNLLSPIVYLFPKEQGKERILARAAVRRIFTEPKTLPHLSGKILKRKHKGVRCSCVDPATNEILNSDCMVCKGTGFVNGYWLCAEDYHIINRNPITSKPAFDVNLVLGTLSPSEVVCLGKALPPVSLYDVWIPDNFNVRFYVTGVQVAADIRGFPVLLALSLRQAEATDIIYKIQI